VPLEDLATPDERLEEVFQYQKERTGEKKERNLGMEFHLHTTYLPVLKRVLQDSQSGSKTEEEKSKRRDRALKELKEVLGTIIYLVEPLSIFCLAQIIGTDGISKETIHKDGIDREGRVVSQRLNPLRSLLNVPNDRNGLVKLFHLSFRDFLSNPTENEFYVGEETEIHERLVRKCLNLLSENLKPDMAGLGDPATLRTGVHQEKVAADISYACRHWVPHLEKSGKLIQDGDELHDLVHDFISQHALHWFEVLSLLGKTSDSIRMIVLLQNCIKVRSTTQDSFRD
jgi:hypothetical protein